MATKLGDFLAEYPADRARVEGHTKQMLAEVGLTGSVSCGRLLALHRRGLRRGPRARSARCPKSNAKTSTAQRSALSGDIWGGRR